MPGEQKVPRTLSKEGLYFAEMAVTVFWLRKSLRLHDNPALCAAIQGSSHVVPLFCLDPWFVRSGRVGVNRMNFLLEVRRGWAPLQRDPRPHIATGRHALLHFRDGSHCKISIAAFARSTLG